MPGPDRVRPHEGWKADVVVTPFTTLAEKLASETLREHHSEGRSAPVLLSLCLLLHVKFSDVPGLERSRVRSGGFDEWCSVSRRVFIARLSRYKSRSTQEIHVSMLCAATLGSERGQL